MKTGLRRSIPAQAALLLLSLAAFGLPAWGQSEPVPLINDPLVPSSAVPGGAGFTLIVNGTGFGQGASVNWNGSPLLTVLDSSKQLTATVPAADIATAGMAYVTVTNPNAAQSSNVALFPITNPTAAVAFAGSAVATLNGPTVLGVADFNGDGFQDIALEDSEGNIDVLLGHGDGTFSAPVVSAVKAGSAGGAVVADFNGDGKLDVATSYVGVYFGNGDGTFTAGPQYQFFPNYGAAVSGGDFNGDGYLDLAVVVCGEFGCEDDIMLGQGGGMFQGAGLFNSAYGGTNLPAIGDLNRDGKLDVAAEDTPTGMLGVFLGNGDGTFQNGVDYGTNYAYNVVTADFNGDGILDLAATNDGGGEVNVYLGNGDGTFGSATTYGVDDNASNMFVGDFNGDGNPDLIVATYNFNLSEPTASLLLGKGDGTFQNYVSFGLGSSVLQAIGDFNGDGRLDFAADTYSGIVSVFLQTTAQLSTTSLTFADQTVGTTSPAQPVTLTNVGTSALSISGITVAGTNSGDFGQRNNCHSSLAAGATCTINVTFKPTATGTRSASLSIAYGGIGSPQTVSLTGTGTQATVQLSPTSLTFGVIVIHTSSASKPITLTNTGNGVLNITGFLASGDFSQTNTCGSSVEAGRSCTINVTFKPTLPGTRTGTLSIADNAPGSPQKVSLTGTGTEVKFSAIGVNFGNQKVGTTSAPVSITLNNLGSTTLDIFSIRIAGADPGDFAETNNCGSSVAAGGSCTITLTFTPTVKGLRSAGLVVYDNGGGSPQGIGLSGSGT